MTVTEFREKSLAGGFDTYHLTDEQMFLTPLAWEAVGKVETEEYLAEEFARVKMHEMIDFLIEGKSIEQYLETL